MLSLFCALTKCSSKSSYANLFYLADTAEVAVNSYKTNESAYHYAAKSAAEMASGSLLTALNTDSCFVLQNGTYPELSFVATLRYCCAHTDIDGDGLCDHCGAGDPDKDGMTIILDYQYLYRYILSRPAQVTLSLDLTGDGQVNALDLQRLYEHLSGERSLFV